MRMVVRGILNQHFRLGVAKSGNNLTLLQDLHKYFMINYNGLNLTVPIEKDLERFFWVLAGKFNSLSLVFMLEKRSVPVPFLLDVVFWLYLPEP